MNQTLLGLPYPDAGDDMRNYPGAVGKPLADRLEVLLADTGWVNMTPVSGTGVCQYRARGGVGEVRFVLTGVTNIAVGSSALILSPGVLPAAYRPGQSVWVAGSFGGAGMCLGGLGTDGAVTLYNPGFNTGNLNLGRLTFVYLLEAKP